VRERISVNASHDHFLDWPNNDVGHFASGMYRNLIFGEKEDEIIWKRRESSIMLIGKISLRCALILSLDEVS